MAERDSSKSPLCNPFSGPQFQLGQTQPQTEDKPSERAHDLSTNLFVVVFVFHKRSVKISQRPDIDSAIHVLHALRNTEAVNRSTIDFCVGHELDDTIDVEYFRNVQ